MTTEREMPVCQVIAQVRALKIAAIEINQDKSVTIAPADSSYGLFRTPPDWSDRFQGDEDDLGYYVVYSDGHSSWTPTAVFESALANND